MILSLSLFTFLEMVVAVIAWMNLENLKFYNSKFFVHLIHTIEEANQGTLLHMS